MIIKNVRFLKTNSGRKGEGMPVVRNPQFYFKEGFCWNNVLQYSKDETTYIKCRIKNKSINDVASMSLYNYYNKTNIYYFICLLNTKLMYNYLKIFINTTINLQVNDFRLFPIIIPNKKELENLKIIFDNCHKIQKQKFNNQITKEESEIKLNQEQVNLEKIVNKLYKI